MRLIVAAGLFDYSVFHVPTCKLLHGVAWVDDVTAEWAQYVAPRPSAPREIPSELRQARKITINTENKVVLIDPIEFSDAAVTAAVDFIQKSEWEGA